MTPTLEPYTDAEIDELLAELDAHGGPWPSDPAETGRLLATIRRLRAELALYRLEETHR